MAQGIDNDVRVEIYRRFLNEGVAPTHLDIAEDLDVSPAETEAAFRRLADDHHIVLAPGSPYIWMANPFSAIRTAFTVRSNEREWWGNCIWDSLGILALAGRDGEVETSCPDCAERLTVTIVDGEIQHDDYIVHFSVPATHWWDDIGST
jgi:hypothetical protein